ncbi:MAG: BON domain-containing protein [Rubrivivax sp.]
MKNDSDIRKDVLAELDWDPAIHPTHVGVAVREGVVTLSGHLDTFAEKFAVERAVQRVEGVRAVAVELDVRLEPGHRRNDAEIATAAESALKWHALVPADLVRVQVEKGWVTLTGEVDWEYQRAAALKAVRPITGVMGVTNSLTLKPQVAPADVADRIRNALARHAEREARHIEVMVKGGTVTLKGQVDSWPERAAAEGASWSAPGIARVVNELTVSR